jgi:hypothetical protein
MAAITAALAGLADDVISYRDVKPHDLLSLDGVWSIGVSAWSGTRLD